MLNKQLSLIRRYDMIAPGDTVICAVSGGADSVALLFSLYLLKDKLGITLKAAHFNHKLRGEESDGDEAFVRRLCDRYDVELYVGQGNVIPGEKGLEAAARDARYAFLESLPGKIATAHTASDNAETVLLHLVRGTGLKGLGGITPVRGRIIRPMLTVTRQEVVTFLEEYALSYREDSSNGTDAFLRNRLRHHVMPLLEQENPQLAQNLSDMAMRLRVDGEFLEELSQPEYPVDVNLLRAMHPARRARILERLLKDSGVREPEAEHISLAEKLVFSEKPSARASFPGGIILRRRYEYLEAEADLPPLKTRVIPCPGEVELPELGLRLVCRESTEPVNEKERFTVPAGESLEVRSRCAGDEIRLSGGTKSLKKLFIDRKIPASNRDRIPVVASREGVLGVYGLGPDAEKYKDEPCWLICFENIER